VPFKRSGNVRRFRHLAADSAGSLVAYRRADERFEEALLDRAGKLREEAYRWRKSAGHRNNLPETAAAKRAIADALIDAAEVLEQRHLKISISKASLTPPPPRE
jgi:hypothetical protein